MILFTAPWCANCKPVKAELEGRDDVTIMDLSSPDGAQKAAELGVRGIPTIVSNNDLIVGQQKCLNFINKEA